jgi:hypothetical protein
MVYAIHDEIQIRPATAQAPAGRRLSGGHRGRGARRHTALAFVWLPQGMRDHVDAIVMMNG